MPLTKAKVEGSKPHVRKYDLRDGGPNGRTGLILTVYPSGRRTFFYQRHRGEKWYKIGPAGPITLEKARLEADRIFNDLKEGLEPGKGDRLTVGAFLDDIYQPHFTAHHRNDKHLANLKPYRQWDSKLLADITATLVKSWRTKRLTSGTKPATINRNVAALKAALSHAVDEGYLAHHPLAGLSRLPAAVENCVRYLTDGEETSLRKALVTREDDIREKRRTANEWRAERGYDLLPDLSNYKFADHLRPMVLLSINTGIRQGELFRLEWQDLVDNVLTVQSGKAKNQRTRYVPLNREALDTVNQWRAQTESMQYVFESLDGKPFDNVKKAWNKVLGDAGIIDFRWHDMHHHFASMLVMASVPLNTVRELLGHSDIKMTLRYAHLAPGHMREAVEAISG